MKELVDKVLKLSKCDNCGGHYTMDGTCFFCRVKNEELAQLLSEVKKRVEENLNVRGLNDIDNQLFRLKGFAEVDAYLKKKDYYKVLESKESDLINKIKNSSSITLEGADAQLVQFFSVNSLNPSNRVALGMYTILSNYVGKNRHNKDDFIDTVKKTFTELMAEYTYHPELVISDIKPSNCREVLGQQRFQKKGKTNRCRISISKSELEKLYSGQSIIPLQTFFHEYFHLIQESSLIGAGVLNRYALNEIEDFILARYMPSEDFYDINYDAISFESDAQVVSCLNVLDLLKRFDIQLKDEDSIQMGKMFQYSNYRLSIPQRRTYKGQTYDIDSLFEMFIQSTGSIEEILRLFADKGVGINIDRINEYRNAVKIGMPN